MKCSRSTVLTLSAIAGLALAGQSVFAGTIFSDDFSSSTLNSLTPSGPTATSTDYQYVSGKGDSVTPAISAGSLTFGITSTSSGTAEVQALFASSPFSIANVGSSLTLTVVFTDTAGILTGNGLLGIGMYNSGAVAPIAGGLDGALSSSTTQDGGTLGWQGYVGQLGYTGLQNNRIMDRQAQTSNYTRNQDLVASGSSSQSYHDPSGSTVGGSSASSLLSLTAGQQYTDVLTYTMTGSGLQIDNNIYNNRLANLASTTATGVTPLATSFDGLAVGWIERGSEATTMEINSINVAAVAVPEPTSMAFLGMGALGMILGLRRSRR